MIVVDASALVDYLLGQSSEVEHHIKNSEICAPYLLDLELMHVLRSYALRKVLSDQYIGDVMNDFKAFPVERYPHEPFLTRIWELRHNFTAYDAAYLALAEALHAKLLTSDKRFAATASEYAEVIVPERHH